MATVIKGLTDKQNSLLRKAFGYESYPNGNSGFTSQAEKWLESKGVKIDVLRVGNAYITRAIQVSDISSLELEIEAIADARKHNKELNKARKPYILALLNGGIVTMYSLKMPLHLRDGLKLHAHYEKSENKTYIGLVKAD